jgi:CRISPR-associated protein Cas6
MKSMTDMVHLSFDLDGGVLPFDYRAVLWTAILADAPDLASDERVGVLPLRTAEGERNFLLSKRVKLVLRLPIALVDHAAQLAGKNLAIGDGWMQLGECKARPIEPYPTLHAHLVASTDDEVAFMENVRAQLEQMKIDAKLICGLHQTFHHPEQVIQGYSLVIHDLKPEASVRLQCTGLGEQRALGCGVFVHYKLISGLE